MGVAIKRPYFGAPLLPDCSRAVVIIKTDSYGRRWLLPVVHAACGLVSTLGMLTVPDSVPTAVGSSFWVPSNFSTVLRWATRIHNSWRTWCLPIRLPCPSHGKSS